MPTVEMVKQENCPRCEDAKKALFLRGITVVEITLATLEQRADRHEIMAEVQLADGKVSIMRLAGTGRWFTSIEELLIELDRAQSADLGR